MLWVISDIPLMGYGVYHKIGFKYCEMGLYMWATT